MIILFEEYTNKIEKRNFEYFMKVVNKCINKFLNEKESEVINDIINVNVKINFTIEIEMSRLGQKNELFYVKTKNKKLYIEDNKVEYYQKACSKLMNNVELLELRGSGWHFQRINSLTMKQSRYILTNGGSYIDLPKWIKDKKAIINIKNTDEKCFLWALIAHFHPVNKNAQRVLKYTEFENEFDFNGINFPIKKTDIPKIEKRFNILVNVLTYIDDNKIDRYYISKQKNIPDKRKITMFYIKSKNDDDYDINNIQKNVSIGHYCLVKNLNRLLNNDTSQDHEKFWCLNCMNSFQSNIKYNKHTEECNKFKPVQYTLPNKDYIEFKDIQQHASIFFVFIMVNSMHR